MTRNPAKSASLPALLPPPRQGGDIVWRKRNGVDRGRETEKDNGGYGEHS